MLFKNDNELRILSRIFMNDEIVLKNLSLSKIDINNSQNINSIIENLKIIYEDHWKKKLIRLIHQLNFH